MKPEIILKSDVLDIIFDGRNKDYGAYELRKYYNSRLIQAIAIMFFLVLLFFALQKINMNDGLSSNNIFPPDPQLTPVELQPDKPKDDKPQDKPQQPKEKQKTITNDVPLIKPDDQVPETMVPTDEDVTRTNIGSVPYDGPQGDPGNQIQPVTGDDGNGKTITPVEPAIPTGPFENAEVMPSFNGDIVKYMLRHIRQPDDLEEGERIVVRVKFIVNEEGNISDVQVIQSGRRDLDEEVVRVVKKMPRWNPGKQGNRAVPVYFNMPVTFVSNP
jgi:periplasmic protein TonB